MLTNKYFATGLIVAISILATPANAGEWKGTTKPGDPQPTPIGELYWQHGLPSICSFSGLNDEYYLLGHEDETRTQSYGTLVSNGDADPHFFNPGQACNEGNN